MKKILITTSSFNTDTLAIKSLQGAGYEIVLNPFKRKLGEDEIFDLLSKDSQIVGIIAGTEPLTKRVLEASALKAISRCGAGMDSVDLDAAQSMGIPVLNTPDAPTDAVAELAIVMMLDVLRGVTLQDRAIRAGDWKRPMGNLLGARKIGIVGYGRIGRRTAEIVKGFGCQVCFYDPYFDCDSGEDMQFQSVKELSQECDVVSLHIPYTRDNHHIIDADILSTMKSSAILINASRGGLVDEDALYAALQNNQIAGAALDVFEEEPYSGKLAELDNIVLTAHTGSYAKEARQKQEDLSAENILKAMQDFDSKAA